MMDQLNLQAIRSLLGNAAPPCVSIYMPTHRGGAPAKEDRVRLKNALVAARRGLVAGPGASRDGESVLVPCRDLLEDEGFWSTTAEGLALFADRQGLRRFRLPCRLDDRVEVSDTFHVGPLLPFLNRAGEFYLLALSERRVRLFRGSSYGMEELDPAGVPRSREEAFEYQQPQFQQTWHARNSPPLPGQLAGSPMFQGHGHGGAPEYGKQERDRFLRVVDRSLNRALRDRSLPLVLAGVDASVASYRSVNTYPRLLDGHVPGNVDHLDAHSLWQKTRPVIDPVLAAGRLAALARCMENAHGEAGGHSFESVTPRAWEGRVEELITAVNRRQWGTFEPMNGRVELHEAAQPGDRELLEFTVGQTILHGGSAYGFDAAEIPGGTWLLASFRY